MEDTPTALAPNTRRPARLHRAGLFLALLAVLAILLGRAAAQEVPRTRHPASPGRLRRKPAPPSGSSQAAPWRSRSACARTASRISPTRRTAIS